MLLRRHITAAMVLVVMLVASLATAVPAEAIMLVSRSQEVRIGRQVEADIIRQYGGLSRDPVQTERVQRIGRSVAAISPRQDVTYTYRVLNSTVINAFAAPGGPVLITQRLAEILNDDELAFVLAHETGHIAAQHGRDAINRAFIAQGIFSLLFRNVGDVVRIGAGIMYTLYDRGYSREQEFQADNYGVTLMTRSGYNPEGSVRALAKLGTGRTPGINQYFSTHPAVPDRIVRVGTQAGIPADRQAVLIRQAQAEISAR